VCVCVLSAAVGNRQYGKKDTCFLSTGGDYIHTADRGLPPPPPPARSSAADYFTTAATVPRVSGRYFSNRTAMMIIIFNEFGKYNNIMMCTAPRAMSRTRTAMQRSMA